MTKENVLALFIILIVLLSAMVSAVSYSYNQKLSITDGSKDIGYVKPYQKNIFGINYAYIEWQREGFPVGNSFPIALIEGTTTALPFGINGELLRVKIGKITNSYVELTIDQSDIQTEINNVDKTLPKNVEAITEDAQKKVEPAINEMSVQLEKLNKDVGIRINKVVQRDYHSSLHVIDTSNSKLKDMSNKIKNKESELAEEIGDSVVYSVLNAFVAPGSGISYKTLVNQLPSSFRHDITTYLYNIESTTASGSEDSFADKGIATLYIGNPNENKISAQFNDQLKSLGLPYFEGNKIVGKRTYSSSDIGLIAAIPEEKYWDKTTLQKRWDADKIRLYKTEIAGIGNEGLETAVLWYNDQLELAKNSISSAVRLSGGAVDEGGVELNEIVSEINKNVKTNPKASIGFSTIAQGWILTGVSSLQNPDFSKVGSLGYVVIVKKEGNSYRTLETHTIVGDKTSYFLDEYQETINQIEDVAENINNVQNLAANQPQTQNMQQTNGMSQATDNIVNKKLENQKIMPKKNPVANFFKNFWRKIFG